jgi:transcriptional regulator with XRE-family HTH domain
MRATWRYSWYMSVNMKAIGRELGAQLRELRQARNLTTRTMAEQIRVSNANISHWETGNRLVPMDRLVTLLDALDVTGDDREELLVMRRRADTAGPSAQLAPLLQYEQTARHIVEWAPLTLPALVQTGDYARALLGQDPDADTKVALRAGRREVLTRKRNPVGYLALIDSSVLARPVADLAVRYDQLEFLLEMSRLPNVTIRLVPANTPGYHPGLAGGFVLLEFPKAQPVVHIEQYRASRLLWDAGDVADYLSAVHRIERRALPPAESADVIEKTMHSLQH